VRVLVVGGGGREHALCWALASSPSVQALFAAPGNPGIEELATVVPLQPTDLDGLAGFAEGERIDLTVVGPEAPLVAGLVDRFEDLGLRAFGPRAAGAQIEGSKTWARRLCRDHGIPSPAYAEFDTMDAVAEYLTAGRVHSWSRRTASPPARG
jgi:phosphoribosylamine--glycine ligase